MVLARTQQQHDARLSCFLPTVVVVVVVVVVDGVKELPSLF